MTITLLGNQKTERMVRTAPKGNIRAIEVNGKPVIQLQVVKYNVVDSYRTVFVPGCLARSISERMPQLTWGHSWADIIGRAFELVSDDSNDGPVVNFYLDDFDAVPRAKQAYAQVQSGTIDSCSIGFGWDYEWHKPTDDELRNFPGAEEMITQVDWDETALVLRGAVPGAKVTGWRSRFGATRSAPLTRSQKWVEQEEAAKIILRLTTEGDDFSLTDALVALRELAIDHPGDPNEGKEDKTTDDSADGANPDDADSGDKSKDGTSEESSTTEPEALEPAVLTEGSDALIDGPEAKSIADEKQQAPNELGAEVADEVLDGDVEAALALVGGY